MRRIAFAMLALSIPASASAVDYPTRKAGLWEMTMTMAAGRTVTMSQCTDQATDKDLITSAGSNPMMQQQCTRTELQKTATGYVSDSTCKFGPMTTTSHTEMSGDFNSQYTVHVTGHNTGGPAMMPADTDMTMAAKWTGPCQAGQNPGDMIMPGGMKVNVRDLQKLRDKLPK